MRVATIVERDALAKAIISACALVAHADGQVDASERRRVMQLMKALSALNGYSSHAAAAKVSFHERAFDIATFLGRENALSAIRTLQPSASDARILICACQAVLEADGIHHPLEYEALQSVCKALNAA